MKIFRKDKHENCHTCKHEANEDALEDMRIISIKWALARAEIKGRVEYIQ